jgi:O-antigen/teichoic acid export membrane protein
VTLGYYSKAQGTEKLAAGTITGVMTAVTYPLYAEMQDDLPKMQNMIKRLTTTISFITFPLLSILILVAKPLFVLLYSERWLESVPYFQVLCIAGMSGCLTSVNTQCIAAIGKSKVMLYWTLIKRMVGTSFIIGGLYMYGMYGLLGGVIINYWFSFFVNIWLVSKHIGYKWSQQLNDILPVVLASFAAALVSYGIGHMLNLSMYYDGILKLFTYIVVYMGWSFLFHLEACTYFLSIIHDKFCSKRTL